MKVLEGHPSAWLGATPEGSSLTIGVFDGVHRGHQRVFAGLTAGDNTTVVVTFDRHPLQVVAPEAAPRLLTSLSHRIDLFGKISIDVVGVLPFEEVRLLSPTEFVQTVIVDAFAARQVAVGTDFRFGHDRTGDLTLLHELGRDWGFELSPIELLEGDGQPISSTAIRILVASGRVAEASRALGRLFELRGVVVRGDGRGHRLGVPTANLSVSDELIVPGRGVYAAWADFDGRRPAAVNVGIRPTFGGTDEIVEAHVLDFEGDLYGDEMALHFHSRIRDELTFESPDELVDAMHRDFAETRNRLKSPEPS
ncbi:MAG: bifunctional riboflavin kinase/FAD synthetase [Acidimicrobiia bacterium]